MPELTLLPPTPQPTTTFHILQNALRLSMRIASRISRGVFIVGILTGGLELSTFAAVGVNNNGRGAVGASAFQSFHYHYPASSISVCRRRGTNNLQALQGSFSSNIHTPRPENHEDDVDDEFICQSCHTPLVFVPGLKGTHLSFYENCQDDEECSNAAGAINTRTLDPLLNFNWSPLSRQRQQDNNKKKRRVWLTLGGLLNVPNLPIDHPHRSLALPLTYDENGVQDRGHLFPDGVIDHVIQLGLGLGLGDGEKDLSIDLFPFYGHVTKHLEDINEEYYQYMSLKNPKSFHNNTDVHVAATAAADKCCRPTAIFDYDWRRSIPELTDEFDKFCESTFPGQQVQILAHSMGGLISYGAMRRNPKKYQPGGVFAGVPFGTGTQYLEDMHRG